MSTESVANCDTLFAGRLSQALALGPIPVIQGDTWISEGEPEPSSGVRNRGPGQNSVWDLWRNEGVLSAKSRNNQKSDWGIPVVAPATKLQELQVLDVNGLVHMFHGEQMYKRLSLLAPSSFTARQFVNAVGETRTREPIAELQISEFHLVVRVSVPTLGRLVAGLDRGVIQDSGWALGRQVVGEGWNPSRGQKYRVRNTRFFESLLGIQSTLHVLGLTEAGEFARVFHSLSILLPADMAEHGRCQSPMVEFYLRELETLVTGIPVEETDKPEREFARMLLTLPKHISIALYRSRKLFYKDDWNPIDNCKKAIARMTEPIMEPSEEERAAAEICISGHVRS